MRILVLSDIHGSLKALETIPRLLEAHRPEAVVACGDLTDFGPASFAAEVAWALRSLPALAVPGNCDPPGTMESWSSAGGTDLHGQRCEVSGIGFVGWGMVKGSRQGHEAIKGLLRPGDVLVLHRPVHGHLDRAFMGVRAGDEGMADLVRSIRPRAVLSGHIHESYGTEEEGGTLFVNPGALRDGRFAVVDASGPLWTARCFRV